MKNCFLISIKCCKVSRKSKIINLRFKEKIHQKFAINYDNKKYKEISLITQILMIKLWNLIKLKASQGKCKENKFKIINKISIKDIKSL